MINLRREEILMKKKLAVVLTALMMLSTSTVFLAAGSPDTGVKAETAGVEVTASETTEAEAKEAVVKVVEKANAETTEVVAVVELNGEVPEDGKVTLSVDGIEDGDDVVALHFYDGAWVERPASVVDGKVVVDFSGAEHFSPVVIAKVAAESNFYYWVASPYGNATTLPKTGAVAVLPIAAMACAAGAVVCGRKEK